MTDTIRRATPEDTADIVAMIQALAEFEHAADQCTVTETQIFTALFGDFPTIRGHVAEVNGGVAAMALWFLNFSTWDGVAGICVDDLFVWPRFRRRGLARGLLSTLARECVDNGYTRLAWSVLNWNSDAIALYDRIGGQPQHEWTIYRLSGPRLAALAAPR
ncbi:GNAT family N-acetyltransferase [Mycobacterium canetti]|uniref:GNAT family N-acetyltransferase n=1 Tax=Mycobacterium canetti TaxID=78331 RepID=UPI0002A5A42F|nr:GNAT family N-acetyltransferase [Mycobacterium canetti]CCK61334.1 N-acetyltransferase Ats1 [Mycobacterium canettii CIPT 140070010]